MYWGKALCCWGIICVPVLDAVQRQLERGLVYAAQHKAEGSAKRSSAQTGFMSNHLSLAALLWPPLRKDTLSVQLRQKSLFSINTYPSAALSISEGQKGN